MRLRHLAVPCFMLFVACAPVVRAGDAIDADRPDVTNGPGTLEPGRWQFEAGATRVGNGGAWTATCGEGLLRRGVAPGFEVRLLLPSWNSGSPGAERGMGDAGAGAKWTVPGGSDAFTAGLVGDVILPTGAPDVSAGTTGADLAFAADIGLGPRADLALNVGGSHQADANALLLSGSCGVDLGGGFGTWGEWAALRSDGAFLHTFDTGLTYKVTPDLQLDARVAAGAGASSGDFTVGAGFAVRW